MTSTLELHDSGHDVIARRTWPVPDAPAATVLVVHGLAEHSGRWEQVGSWLTDAGFRVVSFDLPGFGESSGERAYVEAFGDYLDVVEDLIGELRAHPEPLVLYGHSMGGLISLAYALSDRLQPDLLVLSAPAVDAKVPGWQRATAPLLSRLAPKLSLPNPIDGLQLSRDPAVGEAYFADPLVHTEATMRLGAEFFATMDRVGEQLADLERPTLVIHGGADTIVFPEFTAPLGDLPTVTRRLWPNLRHETHNEPEGEQVIGEVADWIHGRVGELTS
ncbi:MAG: lysophospholipase [Acidimicrobiia bacterium]